MPLAVQIVLYTLIVAGLTIAGAILLWRRSTAIREAGHRRTLRFGLVAAIVTIGTLGTAEAAILGFDPVAVPAALLLGLFGFCVGLLIGAFVTATSDAMSRLRS